MLTFGSLFAGIGGFDLGFERAGMRGVWQVEIDPFCQKILRKHFPHAVLYGDITELDENELEPVDVICGGFPCQDVSLAGKRAGLNGKRSTLWSEFYRIVCKIQPRWVVIENVSGLLSSDDGRFFGKILRELSESGYDAEWDTLPAYAFGAPHERERLFIVAHAHQHSWIRRERGLLQVASTSGQRRDYIGGTTGNYWAQDRPAICRMDDGLSDGMDENARLGNAVVPQIAEWIGRRIVEIESET